MPCERAPDRRSDTCNSGRKMSLSPARLRLPELMQRVNFGRIEKLRGREGDPVFGPHPHGAMPWRLFACAPDIRRPSLAVLLRISRTVVRVLHRPISPGSRCVFRGRFLLKKITPSGSDPYDRFVQSSTCAGDRERVNVRQKDVRQSAQCRRRVRRKTEAYRRTRP